MIFNLFKTRPILKELIPQGFVDIHSHILPGIDDGAKDIEDSLELISKMKEMGFSKIYGTPHIYPGLYNNNKKTIKLTFEKLLKKTKNNYQIDYACEYMINHSLIEKSEKKKLITLKDQYVLVEMSFSSKFNMMNEVFFKMRINNYKPIIAHPERYLYLKNRDLFKLKNMGCFFQLNLLSLVGYYGNHVLARSKNLLRNNLIDFTGSDIHNKRQLEQFSKKIKLDNYKNIEYLCSENNNFH